MSMLTESRRWKMLRESLLQGDDIAGDKNATRRKNLETVLDNTRKHMMLAETATAGATQGTHSSLFPNSGNVAPLNKVILPVIRRVMPTIIANDLIGVQPMQGPIAQIHTLRVKYNGTKDQAGNAITPFGANPSNFTDTQEAFSPSAIAASYSGQDNKVIGRFTGGNAAQVKASTATTQDYQLTEAHTATSDRVLINGTLVTGTAGTAGTPMEGVSVTAQTGNRLRVSGSDAAAFARFQNAEIIVYDTAQQVGAAPTGLLEGVPGRDLSIEILRQVAEAKTRKLSARWTFEAGQDAMSQQGVDIEAEIMAALAQEITAEIDQEILFSLRRLANDPSKAFGTTNTEAFDQNSVSGTATYVGDEHAALAVLINRVSNKIAQRTRRGSGNWAVVSPTALTILQSASTSAFARTTEGTFEAPTNNKQVGVLNSSVKIYVDTYATDNTEVLVGYKGSTEADAAAFYCPYVPLMSSGTVLDPNTLEPLVGFMTRYAYIELQETESSLGNASDYLGRVTIQNTQFS